MTRSSRVLARLRESETPMYRPATMLVHAGADTGNRALPPTQAAPQPLRDADSDRLRRDQT